MQSWLLVVTFLWVLLRVVFDYLAMFRAGLPSSVRLCFGQPCRKSDAEAATNAQTGLLQLFRGDCPRYFLQFFLRQQIPLLCSLPKPLNRLSFVCRDTFAI